MKRVLATIPLLYNRTLTVEQDQQDGAIALIGTDKDGKVAVPHLAPYQVETLVALLKTHNFKA